MTDDVFMRIEPNTDTQVDYSIFDAPNGTKSGLIEGRIVHFTLGTESQSPGEHRPAIIVKVWENGVYKKTGSVNLRVFADFTNDGEDYADGNVWRTSVPFDPSGTKPNTLHWIEKA